MKVTAGARRALPNTSYSSRVAEDLLGELRARSCPVCGSTDDSEVFAAARLDTASLGRFAFSARKRPEHMGLRLVRCPGCDLVYASPVPTPEVLARAYRDAAFDGAMEGRLAACTYRDALAPLLQSLPDRVGALDIGTGEGAFLGELLDAGFSEVGGVEPSTDPVAAAEARVADLIVHDVFRPGVRPVGSLSLVTCFQTIEHVPDPAVMVRDAAELLKPGGLLALVCHDRRAPVNRLLGLRSPIVDIEHQQLFSPGSITRLLQGAGLVDISHRTIRNRYPVAYWARLLPLPGRAGEVVERLLVRAGVGERTLSVPVGNLFAWGRRSSAATASTTRASAV